MPAPSCLSFIGNEYWPTWQETSETFPNCSEGWLYGSDQSNTDPSNPDGGGTTLIVYEAPPPFDPSSIDGSIATMLFTAGFSMTFGPFVVAWMYKAVFKVFRA